MAADREGLREALARVIDPDSWARYDHYRTSGKADRARDEIADWLIAGSLKTADALIAGPLSDLLTKADSAERMEAERKARPNEVTTQMLAAAWEVVRDRYPHGRVLGPGPGFREAIIAALALRPLCDLEAQIVVAETEAEVDREFAETSRLQAVELRADLFRLSAEVEALRLQRDAAEESAARYSREAERAREAAREAAEEAYDCGLRDGCGREG